MAGGEYDSKTKQEIRKKKGGVRKGTAAFTVVKYSEPGIYKDWGKPRKFKSQFTKAELRTRHIVKFHLYQLMHLFSSYIKIT